ncbi:MAG: xanthine dehydrogenase family protein subunit M [Candidatus Binatia bacterium]
MKSFTFLAAGSVAEAVAALREHGAGARVLAGGQSLLLAMKDRLATPSAIVSIGRLPELRGCSRDNGVVQIGAATTYFELETADLGTGASELVGRVCAEVADIPVRRMGTAGGALCQADPQFDFPVGAVALGAELELASPRGRRAVAAAEFLKGRGKTACAPDEILTAIRFRPGDGRTGAAFEKFAVRRFDPAIASVACVLRVADGGAVAEARIVCGGVAETPLRLTGAEGVITGQALTEKLADEAGRLSSAELPTTSLNALYAPGYRRQLVPALVSRALRRAYTAAAER